MLQAATTLPRGTVLTTALAHGAITSRPHAALIALPTRTASHTGTHGLYVDGDIVASELYALQYAARLCGLDCPNLDDHLTDREAQLTQARPEAAPPGGDCSYRTTCRAYARRASRAQLGSFHENLRIPSISDDDRRDFAKAVISMSTHGAASKPRADADGTPANDIARAFAKHGVPLNAKVRLALDTRLSP